MSLTYVSSQLLEVVSAARVELFLFCLAFSVYWLLSVAPNAPGLKGQKKVSTKKIKKASGRDAESNSAKANGSGNSAVTQVLDDSASEKLREQLVGALKVGGSECENQLKDTLSQFQWDSPALVPIVKEVVGTSGHDAVLPLLRVATRELRLAHANSSAVFGGASSQDGSPSTWTLTTTGLWNVALDAAAMGQSLQAAEALMKTMMVEGCTDIVSWNTLIKAYLHHNAFDRAQNIMRHDMKKAGFEPNVVTYNELLHALSRSDRANIRERVWEVSDRMKRDGVKPNKITCSILVSSLKPRSSQSDVMRTLELIDSIDESLDEVLHSSVLEACMRVGRPELVKQKLALFPAESATGSRTFGTLIKAYGHIKDVTGVWRCWRIMRSRHIKMTSVTIGCMVEAVVSNGDADGGYELICSMNEDETCKDQMNAIVYGSVLKGYGRLGRLQRVTEIFEEMLGKGIQPTLASYNSVVDACARKGDMTKVPDILKQMKGSGMEPNLITHTTIIKGFSQAGDVDAALNALRDLRSTPAVKPDEIVYSTILGGCLLAAPTPSIVQSAEGLFKELQDEGLTPTNHVLSCMAKLLGRVGRLEEAFELVNKTSKHYRFNWNGQVWSALIQACLSSADLQRAMATHAMMTQSQQQADAQTYQCLLKALVDAGKFADARQLFRSLSNSVTPTSTHSIDRQRASVGLDAAFLSSLQSAILIAKDRFGSEASVIATELSSDIASLRQNNGRSDSGNFSDMSRDRPRRRLNDSNSEGRWRKPM